MVDHLIKQGLTSPDLLRQCLTDMSGYPGIAHARHAVRLAAGASESPRESEVLYWIVESGLPLPRQQAIIVDSRGVFVARVDMLFEDVKLCVEYDGRAKLQGAYGIPPDEAARREVDRSRGITNGGYRIIHITAENFRDGSGIRLVAETYRYLKKIGYGRR